MKRSMLRQHMDVDPRPLDFNLEETRHQITAWADRQIGKSRWESQFAAMRGLGTDGCVIYFFISSIALALLLLLQFSAGGQ